MPTNKEKTLSAATTKEYFKPKSWKLEKSIMTHDIMTGQPPPPPWRTPPENKALLNAYFWGYVRGAQVE